MQATSARNMNFASRENNFVRKGEIQGGQNLLTISAELHLSLNVK